VRFTWFRLTQSRDSLTPLMHFTWFAIESIYPNSTILHTSIASCVVYILRCGDGRLYTGVTNNLERRLKAHRAGKGAKFTKGRFWKLAYSKRYESKNIALKEEYKLKVNYKLRNQIKKKFIENENISFTSL